jgi:hypothetical protein
MLQYSRTNLSYKGRGKFEGKYDILETAAAKNLTMWKDEKALLP